MSRAPSNKVTFISNLDKGDRFKFANLTNFKDMIVKRYSDCGVCVGGVSRNHEEDPWKPLSAGYVVSVLSEVILL